jgi:hypothetical protein
MDMVNRHVALRCGISFLDGFDFRARRDIVDEGKKKSDERFAYVPPQERVEELKGFGRRPSATVVLSDELAGEVIDARAVTPAGGW